MYKKPIYTFLLLFQVLSTSVQASQSYTSFNPPPSDIDTYLLNVKPENTCFVPRNEKEYSLTHSVTMDKSMLKKKLLQCTRIEKFTWSNNQKAVTAFNKWIKCLKSQKGKVIWVNLDKPRQRRMGIIHKSHYYFIEFNTGNKTPEVNIHHHNP